MDCKVFLSTHKSPKRPLLFSLVLAALETVSLSLGSLQLMASLLPVQASRCKSLHPSKDTCIESKVSQIKILLGWHPSPVTLANIVWQSFLSIRLYWSGIITHCCGNANQRSSHGREPGCVGAVTSGFAFQRQTFLLTEIKQKRTLSEYWQKPECHQ